jgi:ribose/xylose/arabinose/galactoside ABC-type transport system permease subunit
MSTSTRRPRPPSAIIADAWVQGLVLAGIDLSVAAVFAMAPVNMQFLTDY